MTQFYARLPKKITETSARLRKAMESGEIDNDAVLKAYFQEHWDEFKAWWLKNMGERIDWMTFARAPHNCEFFTQWVFRTKDGKLDEVEQALTQNGW